VEAERVLGIAVVRVAAIADSVAVDVRLIRVGDARTVVSAVDDPVTVAVDTARAWRADPALAGARAPADRTRTAGGSVRPALAVGGAAITRHVGPGIALLARIDVAVATLRGHHHGDRAERLLRGAVRGAEVDHVGSRLRDQRRPRQHAAHRVPGGGKRR